MTRQDALDAKQDRDDRLWWALYREISDEQPDWTGEQILAEIARRVIEMAMPRFIIQGRQSGKTEIAKAIKAAAEARGVTTVKWSR